MVKVNDGEPTISTGLKISGVEISPKMFWDDKPRLSR